MSPRTDRVSGSGRARARHRAAAGVKGLARTARGRTRSLVYVGTALAVAGVGSATAASAASAATVSPATVSGPPAAPLSIAALASATHIGPITPMTATAQQGRRPPAAARPASSEVPTWPQVRAEINQQTNPVAARLGQLPAADRLLPVATSGPQAWMPISPAQLANATTIVQQALDKRMGIRSAVIAVATSMQESRLLNLQYGDADSLGLFQQRPSMGWGTAAQITEPAYAATAFLTALQRHQAGDPAWAWQPLWVNAQTVQNSGFPFAYAKWEAQAAGLVKQIAMRLK